MSRPTLGGNVLRSLAGQVAPGIAAVVALPALLRGLGADGLGVLHVTWAVVGYFCVMIHSDCTLFSCWWGGVNAGRVNSS